jgi:hypothetical protein
MWCAVCQVLCCLPGDSGSPRCCAVFQVLCCPPGDVVLGGVLSVRYCAVCQVSYKGLSCEEEAPACGGTCGKLLLCRQHHCVDRCHTGPCPAVCRALTVRSCSCGRVSKEAPCCEVCHSPTLRAENTSYVFHYSQSVRSQAHKNREDR